MRADRARLRILIVDDDLPLCRQLHAIVSEAGFGQPAAVATGTDGLRAAAEADLILLDQHLPDTSGIALLPALLTLPHRPSLILLTAHGEEALAAQALRVGADDYLIKDGSLPDLLPELIERARRQRALREALAAAERDLVHTERLAAIGQLNVTLHHTVNNPLMTAFAELELLRGAGIGPEARASVESIYEALVRIRDTVQRLVSLRHAQTTDYLDGIEMIDLSRRSRPMPAHLGDALVYCPDDAIARVVGMLLTHAGFQVERVPAASALPTRLGNGGARLVMVTCSGAPGAEPLSGFRPDPGRHYTLVALVAGSPEPARTAGADHVVSLPFDPGTFVSELLDAMRG